LPDDGIGGAQENFSASHVAIFTPFSLLAEAGMVAAGLLAWLDFLEDANKKNAKPSKQKTGMIRTYFFIRIWQSRRREISEKAGTNNTNLDELPKS